MRTKNLMKQLAIIAIGCMVVMSTSAVQANTWQRVKAAGKITIGNSPDYPPFETLDDNGDRIGFDIDLFSAMAEYMGVTPKFVTLDFGAIITAVQSGQVNVGMSGFSINEERKAMVSFTNPYFISGQAVVTTPETGIKSVADLKGKRVAVGLGTTGQKEAEKIDGVKIQFPDDYNVAFVMLKNGGSDAVVADIPVVEEYMKQGGFVMVGKPLSYEEFAIIGNKDDAELMKQMNAAMDKVKSSGKYEELLKKWKLK